MTRACGTTCIDTAETGATYAKPLPTITPSNRPYWDGLNGHEVRLPRCRACGAWAYPIAPLCPSCWSEDLDWSLLSQRGVISSWVVYARPNSDPSFADDIPYTVVEVEMEEGIRVISNLVPSPRQVDVKAGLRVEAVFHHVTEDVTLLKFTPAAEQRK